MNPSSTRGPRRHIILAAPGQDIRACAHCGACDQQTTHEMDFALGGLFQAAAHPGSRYSSFAVSSTTGRPDTRLSRHSTGGWARIFPMKGWLKDLL